MKKNVYKGYTKEDIDKAYNEGNPLISDSEYDKVFGINATGKIAPDKNSAWEKHKHINVMSSLTKVDLIDENGKPDFTVVEEWINKQKSDYVCSPKYDGCSIKIYYKDGKLINAVTRGSGIIGEDVTRNILKADNVRILIDNNNITEVMGEVILPLDSYEKYLNETEDSKPYANPRNGATGALKDLKGRNAKYLSVRYYGLNTKNKNTDTEFKKFSILKSIFEYVDFEVVSNIGQLKRYYDEIYECDKNYLADGIVITMDEISLQNKLGRDGADNPKYSMALKFPVAIKTTTLKNIAWQIGKIGTLTPVAIVEEVDLGVKVTRASLANLDEVNRLWGDKRPRIGDKVEISRRGDVIPHIEKVVEFSLGKEIKTPTICPICNSPVAIDGPMLTCTNGNCEARQLGDLYKWSDTIKDYFKCKGLGPERIYQMYKVGLIKNVVDLYKIKPINLLVLDGVKEKAAENMLSFQQYKEIPLHLFIGGMNIPNIGSSIIKFLVDAGYDTFEKIMTMSKEQMSEVENLGEVRADIILKWLKKKESLMNQLLKYVTIEQSKEIEMASNKLDGKSFCITGKLSLDRSDMEDEIKKNGGTIKGVSSKLDILIVGEKPGSKLAKATKLGTKIINETALWKMIGK